MKPRKNHLLKAFFIIVFICITYFARINADQTVISGYTDAKDNYFWSRLYINAGESLYCGLPLPFPHGEIRTIEHVYPADWMAKHYGCENRSTCDNEHYKRAEGDLHNLWPELGRINSSRKDFLYREIYPDQLRFTHLCPDYERSPKQGDTPAYVEPRDVVKGNIARAIFYMHDEYGFSFKGMLPMLKRWNRLDPPGEHEYWRNDRIYKLQGTRNKYIDNYSIGDSLSEFSESQ